MSENHKPAMAKTHPEPEPLVTKGVVADRAKVSLRTVENWCRDRRIGYYKIGKLIRFRWSEVEAALAATCHVPARKP